MCGCLYVYLSTCTYVSEYHAMAHTHTHTHTHTKKTHGHAHTHRARHGRTLHSMQSARFQRVRNWVGCRCVARRRRAARPIPSAAAARCAARVRQCKHSKPCHAMRCIVRPAPRRHAHTRARAGARSHIHTRARVRACVHTHTLTCARTDTQTHRCTAHHEAYSHE